MESVGYLHVSEWNRHLWLSSFLSIILPTNTKFYNCIVLIQITNRPGYTFSAVLQITSVVFQLDNEQLIYPLVSTVIHSGSWTRSHQSVSFRTYAANTWRKQSQSLSISTISSHRVPWKRNVPRPVRLRVARNLIIVWKSIQFASPKRLGDSTEAIDWQAPSPGCARRSIIYHLLRASVWRSAWHCSSADAGGKSRLDVPPRKGHSRSVLSLQR